jgi:TetR/AcrR family transcriptional regulator
MTSHTSESNQRQIILDAATTVFSEQGINGARIEHIARKAGVNKALVYYYYGSKRKLYECAIKSQFHELFDELKSHLEQESIKDSNSIAFLKQFVRIHFKVITKRFPHARFLIGALVDEPKTVQAIIREMAGDEGHALPKLLRGIIEGGIARSELRPVNPKQLIISMLGMNLIYFIAKPIAEVFMELNVEDEELFLEERLTSVVDLLLYGIVERRPA